MIVKIQRPGKSFSGLATYLMHDPDHAKTAERVAWTHTHNLANDHVGAAVNEMLWTARDAELLKQEAGVRAGGRATESPVKHISLNFAPGENPTREHMIETTKEFLAHMKWQEHQAILFGHRDKAYSHVHIMLNAVHPETGLRLNDDFEWRRAQEFALGYEREHGRIYCEERLKGVDEREKSLPRNIWMEFSVNQKEFENAEKSLRENTPIISYGPINDKNEEWKILKEIQRTERMDFFANGKFEFSQLRLSIYREVREEFRGRWSDYYSAARNGGDPEALAELKAKLVADQKAVLEPRRDAACEELRAARDIQYRTLLDDQREFRAHLRERQRAGLDNTDLLQSLRTPDHTQDISSAFREAADSITRRVDDGARTDSKGPVESERGEAGTPGPDGTVIDLGLGATKVFDSLLSIFEGPSLDHRPRGPDLFQSAADEATRRQQREREEEADAESRKRQRVSSWE